MRSVVALVGSSVFAATLSATGVAAADPPTPSAPHPRLFMSAAQLAAYQANAAKQGTAAAELIAQCQDTIDNPSSYRSRGGSDGNYWPQSAVACAFAYVATKNSQFLTQALTYWKASLNDDQTIGDGAGCVQGVSTNWQSWEQGGESGAAPPVLLTITHDTGYPIRWYGADISLVYDWLYGATGVDSALQAQTRTCLTNWIDWYSGYGYHHDEAGANYNAGYVVSKSLAAIAIGTDGGADGHLWTQVIDQDFGKLLMGNGLSGATGGAGTPAGVMVGGDWGEGWQYGPLSVLEYAASARALEDQGASLPPMDEWASSLAMRSIYATTPSGGFEFCGNGDCDITTPNKTLEPNELDAVLVGPSSDQAASWALAAKQGQSIKCGSYAYNAIAEARSVTPQSYAGQSPAPSLFYVARGTRQLYARSGWDTGATWGVFMSEPQLNSDHQHFDASNFVLSHGADDLVVDPTPYGNESSWESNAVTADSSVVKGNYAPSQTPWSLADLPWARGTADATYGARSDFAHAFDFDGTSSDITYAHREWTMLPEGEVVTIDRVHTSGSSHNMYVQFHTNTGGGGLSLSNGVATGTVGGSKVAIHAVLLSGGTPAVKQPTDCANNSSDSCCSISCSYPCGSCSVGRFATDEYQVSVPGPWAVAVHVIDALAGSDSPATVASLSDATVDPSGANTGVIGASVVRNGKQSYVVASSGTDGAVSGGTLTYGTPGAGPARHVVYDAPEASDGTSSVTAAAQSGRCVVTITAGAGKGLTGHPLMFDVGAASGGCVVTDATSANPGNPPSGGDAGAGGSSSGGSSGGSSSGASSSSGSSGGATGGSSSGSDDGGAPANGNDSTWNFGGPASGCGCVLTGAGVDDETVLFVAMLALGAGLVRRRFAHARSRR
ncbi:MAG TPA: hypothetical protein VF765_18550 [Polyangiaceae bacterium]